MMHGIGGKPLNDTAYRRGGSPSRRQLGKKPKAREREQSIDEVALTPGRHPVIFRDPANQGAQQAPPPFVPLVDALRKLRITCAGGMQQAERAEA